MLDNWFESLPAALCCLELSAAAKASAFDFRHGAEE
jgi:hypothetical protein